MTLSGRLGPLCRPLFGRQATNCKNWCIPFEEFRAVKDMIGRDAQWPRRHRRRADPMQRDMNVQLCANGRKNSPPWSHFQGMIQPRRYLFRLQEARADPAERTKGKH